METITGPCGFLAFPNLRGPSVFPACRDVGDDAGMALLADIDPVDFDNALAGMQARDGRHCACQGRGNPRVRTFRRPLVFFISLWLQT